MKDTAVRANGQQLSVVPGRNEKGTNAVLLGIPRDPAADASHESSPFAKWGTGDKHAPREASRPVSS